jgi:signal peptidase II
MNTANAQDAVPAADSDGRAATDRARVEGAERAGARASRDAPDESGRVRRIGVLIAVALAVYALDVASKLLVVATMHYGSPIRVLGPVLSLDYTRNPGAAFSIGETYTIIFAAIAVGVIVVILRLARQLYSLPWAVALGLLLGGALGNLTDRIVRAPGVFRGWVVDFIHLPHWPIFNLADSGIVVGGVLMVLLAFRGLHPDGTVEPAPTQDRGAGAAADAPRTSSDGSNGAGPESAGPSGAGRDGSAPGNTSPKGTGWNGAAG